MVGLRCLSGLGFIVEGGKSFIDLVSSEVERAEGGKSSMALVSLEIEHAHYNPKY